MKETDKRQRTRFSGGKTLRRRSSQPWQHLWMEGRVLTAQPLRQGREPPAMGRPQGLLPGVPLSFRTEAGPGQAGACPSPGMLLKDTRRLGTENHPCGIQQPGASFPLKETLPGTVFQQQPASFHRKRTQLPTPPHAGGKPRAFAVPVKAGRYSTPGGTAARADRLGARMPKSPLSLTDRGLCIQRLCRKGKAGRTSTCRPCHPCRPCQDHPWGHPSWAAAFRRWRIRWSAAGKPRKRPSA